VPPDKTLSSRLAEPEKGLEDMKLHLVPVGARLVLEQPPAIVLPELVVAFPLFRFEVDGKGLLDSRGMLGGHLPLPPPKDEGAERPGEKLPMP